MKEWNFYKYIALALLLSFSELSYSTMVDFAPKLIDDTFIFIQNQFNKQNYQCNHLPHQKMKNDSPCSEEFFNELANDSSFSCQNVGEKERCVRFTGVFNGITRSINRPLSMLRGCFSNGGGFFTSSDVAKCIHQEVNKESLEKLFRKVIYPAVKKAVESYGLETDGNACNLAAGLTVSALKLLGIETVKIKEGRLHAYVEVKTRDGEEVILDPTASQFYKKGSSAHRELNSWGFAGSKKDLQAFIESHIAEHDPPAGFDDIPLSVLKAHKGLENSDISYEEAEQFLAVYRDRYFGTYFGNPSNDGELRKAAIKQVQFYERHDPNEKLIRRVLFQKLDATDRTIKAYNKLVNELKDYQPSCILGTLPLSIREWRRKSRNSKNTLMEEITSSGATKSNKTSIALRSSINCGTQFFAANVDIYAI